MVEAARALAQSVDANSKGDNKMMEDLQALADMYSNIAAKKKKVEMDNTVKNNGIKTYEKDGPSPRVQTPPPRVQEDPRLIVASSVASNVACPKKANSSIIFEEDSDTPANNTRARKNITRTITQEAVLSTMELSQAQVSAKNIHCNCCVIGPMLSWTPMGNCCSVDI